MAKFIPAMTRHIAQTSASSASVTYSADASLTGDIVTIGDITINAGVTVTTNGYNFYCNGTFTNNGTINVGNWDGGSGGIFTTTTSATTGTDASNSYGGSGGGGTGGFSNTGARGGNTLSAGGATSDTDLVNAGDGATPAAPTVTNALIQTLHANGLSNYLVGSGGGGGGMGNNSSSNYGANGGQGAFGLYIQANKIIAGTINAAGTNGGAGYYNVNNPNTVPSSLFWGGGGGGGGGVILLAYGAGGYTAGTYDVSGGVGQPYDAYSDLSYIGTFHGGNGAAGQVLAYDYGATQPIAIPSTTYSLTSSLANLISLSYTPKFTGLLKVTAIYQISAASQVSLYDGTEYLNSVSPTYANANQVIMGWWTYVINTPVTISLMAASGTAGATLTFVTMLIDETI